MEVLFMKTTTVRLDDKMLDRVDGLAKALSRSRSWVINSAIERFLEYEEWFVLEVKDGLAEVEKGEVADHEEVIAKFRKWGANAS
jgi:predicted transcriptional regulator